MFADFLKEPEKIVEAKTDYENVEGTIRGLGLKIKMDIPTNFGVEYILAKVYSQEEMGKLENGLKGLKKKGVLNSYKIKGNSIFVD